MCIRDRSDWLRQFDRSNASTSPALVADLYIEASEPRPSQCESSSCAAKISWNTVNRFDRGLWPVSLWSCFQDFADSLVDISKGLWVWTREPTSSESGQWLPFYPHLKYLPSRYTNLSEADDSQANEEYAKLFEGRTFTVIGDSCGRELFFALLRILEMKRCKSSKKFSFCDMARTQRFAAHCDIEKVNMSACRFLTEIPERVCGQPGNFTHLVHFGDEDVFESRFHTTKFQFFFKTYVNTPDRDARVIANAKSSDIVVFAFGRWGLVPGLATSWQSELQKLVQTIALELSNNTIIWVPSEEYGLAPRGVQNSGCCLFSEYRHLLAGTKFLTLPVHYIREPPNYPEQWGPLGGGHCHSGPKMHSYARLLLQLVRCVDEPWFCVASA